MDALSIRAMLSQDVRSQQSRIGTELSARKRLQAWLSNLSPDKTGLGQNKGAGEQTRA